MRRSVFGLLAMLVFTALAVSTMARAAAQDDIEVQFPVDVFACDTAPAIGDYDLTGLSGPPADCVPAEGVAASVTNADGAELGACTTGSDGRCIVPFLFDDAVPDVTVTVDESTMPDGYSRMQLNPISVPANLEHGVLFAGILTVSQPDPPSSGESNLTMTVINCPPTGPDAPIDNAECVEPGAGIEFAVATPATGNVEFLVTDANGVFTVSLDPYTGAPGTSPVAVSELLLSNPYGEVVGYDAGCVNDVTGEDIPLEFEVGEVAPGGPTYRILFEATASDQISCTWFNSYQVDPGEGDATVAPEPVEPEPIEPDPDALQVSIRGGSCDETGDIVAELSGAQLPDGDAVGHEAAVLAQTSVSSASVSLDDLLAGEHVIDVRSPDDDTTVLACGEIGGVLDSNGDLTIGLREVDASGFSGIAYLAPNDLDAAQTGISVFLAEGLTPEEEDASAEN